MTIMSLFRLSADNDTPTLQAFIAGNAPGHRIGIILPLLERGRFIEKWSRNGE